AASPRRRACDSGVNMTSSRRAAGLNSPSAVMGSCRAPSAGRYWKTRGRPWIAPAPAMPPAAISIGCTCWRTSRSTSASSARAAVGARRGGRDDGGGGDDHCSGHAPHRSLPGSAPACVTTLLDCNVFAGPAELIRVHVMAAGPVLSARPRESGDPDSKDWIPAYAGMNGGVRRLSAAKLRELGVIPLPALGALLPPLGGEGWGGGGTHESCCMPPPCPSPVNGGGERTECAASVSALIKRTHPPSSRRRSSFSRTPEIWRARMARRRCTSVTA